MSHKGLPKNFPEKFGRLTPTDKDGPWVNCRCDCGVQGRYRMDRLKSGKTRSCGCLTQERRGQKASRVAERLHPAWAALAVPQDAGSDWANFDAFLFDMSGSWYKGAVLGRRSERGHYDLTNFRWVDKPTAARSTRGALRVRTTGGAEIPLAQFAAGRGIKYGAAYRAWTRAAHGQEVVHEDDLGRDDARNDPEMVVYKP